MRKNLFLLKLMERKREELCSRERNRTKMKQKKTMMKIARLISLNEYIKNVININFKDDQVAR